MVRTAIWVTRLFGCALVVVLWALNPPSDAGAVRTQGVALGVAGVAFGVWGVWDGRRGRWFPVVLGVIAGAGAVGGTGGGGGGTLVAFSVMAVLAAGNELALGWGLAVAGCGVAGAVVGGLVFAVDVGTLLGYPLLLVSALLFGRNRRSYRVRAEQSAALLAQYERLQAEQRRADVLDERARIAREIHDVLAHSLGALGIQIQAARAVLTSYQDVDRALDVLATAQRLATEGLEETRRAVHALRADSSPERLDAALARVVREHGERHGVRPELSVEGEAGPLPPDATLALLRTAQEALVNCAKHAPGRWVGVTLGYAPESVRLEIVNEVGDAEAAEDAEDADAADQVGDAAADPYADPGPGPGTPLRTAGLGYGLTGMRERLLLLHGTLDAGRRGARWVVAARLPRTHHERPRPEAGR
jgi:signal transduction histidine kinase